MCADLKAGPWRRSLHIRAAQNAHTNACASATLELRSPLSALSNIISSSLNTIRSITTRSLRFFHSSLGQLPALSYFSVLHLQLHASPQVRFSIVSHQFLALLPSCRHFSAPPIAQDGVLLRNYWQGLYHHRVGLECSAFNRQDEDGRGQAKGAQRPSCHGILW